MTQEAASHLSFSVPRSGVIKRILIPKYYDPELDEATKLAGAEFFLPTLKSILGPGSEGSRLGTWIPREFYGTGPIPFIRTSDFNNWRLRPDYKKSVSAVVYERVKTRQDLKSGDILMVAHGTYLVGSVALLTDSDLPIVLQDHVFRLRVSPSSKTQDGGAISSELVLAALSTSFVRRQVRARQFSADIIDKIGERHLELLVPIPRNAEIREKVETDVGEVVKGQTEVREKISTLLDSKLGMTRERSVSKLGFSVKRSNIKSNILIPKYYDPSIVDEMKEESVKWGSWTSIQSLIVRGILECNTGVEVGKMAYGTGVIPFVRTTDIAELELKASPRQGVSQEIFDKYKPKAALTGGDIILVRDGTYLVGSSALVTDDDLPALICGGLYRLRLVDKGDVNPSTLLALLNLRSVRRQMRAKQFTRDVIDTLGKRLFEVMIPDPLSEAAKILGSSLGDCMVKKSELRSKLLRAVKLLEPSVPQVMLDRPGWSMR